MPSDTANVPYRPIPPGPPGQGTTTASGYYPVVAWIITIGLFFLIAKTKIGYTFLYIFVIASIIIVLAIGSPTVVAVFQTVSPQPTKPKA